MKRTKVKSKLRIQQIFTISFLLFISLNLISIPTYAQVTIGSNLEPEKAAVLDIKEKADKDGGPTVEKGGLILPRVNLEKKKQLYPFIREKGYSASNYDNASYDPNVADPDYAKEKPAHKGLIVYNLTENEEEELCLGLNQWDGEEWNCFEEKMGNAIAHIVNCDDFKVFGLYKSPDKYPDTPSDDVSLDASNYVTIKLKVTKPGAYTITVTPKYAAAQNDETNGYFFTANGVFMEKGVYNVILQGSGTPFWYTPEGNIGDELTVVMNDKPLTLENGTTCVKNVQVADYSKKANYTMDCNRTKVHGVYILNKALDPASNYISVWITMDPSDKFVEGSVVYMNTNQVDGISFASTATKITAADVAAGEKEIILRGTGTPTSVDTKKMTITANSAISVATCYANVTVAFTKKTILGLGLDNGFGYNIAGTYGNISLSNIYYNGGRKMLTAPANFGLDPNSTIKVEGYNLVSGGSPSGSDLKKHIDTNKPDIIVIGYAYAPSDDAIDVLIDYMSKKGVVIAAIENNGGIQRLFERTLNLPKDAISVSNRGGAGTIKTFSYIPQSELLNGPFGDIREKKWGEDASTTKGVSNVPVGTVEILSNGIWNGSTDGGNMITICRFKENNLIFIGDGGFWSRALEIGGINSNIICPLYYDENFRPIVGKYGSGTGYTNSDIYNSFFFANMMAWAIKTAQFDGYNTPR